MLRLPRLQLPRRAAAALAGVAVVEARHLKGADRQPQAVPAAVAAVRPPKAAELVARVVGAVARPLKAEARLPAVGDVVALLQLRPLLRRNSPMVST